MRSRQSSVLGEGAVVGVGEEEEQEQSVYPEAQ
jgi:hypothetical protein